ncbi:PKD domain-containing protein [Dyella tabacisoli]|uniref:PKD domain-containing protein n=1 Tax=Dyella tabacisoli TaxID=2282381 RepID=UPI001CDCCCA6|nr:PKD domain-containing protein [Dyella tabacisoli]
MKTKLSRRYEVAVPLMLIAAMATASVAQAAQRTVQLPENGVTTKPIQNNVNANSLILASSLNRICQPNARWMRLGFKQLQLSPYDSLTLVSSEGDRVTFEGNQWNNRAFNTRALRGACVDIQPSFGNPASDFKLESYQYSSQALDATSVVVAGAGDICDSSGTVCQGTSDLIVSISPTAVFTAGDSVYESGTLSEYQTNYDPKWGRFKNLTSPAPGNHDYNTSGASGYFDYFNGVGVQTGPAGDRSKGYYSWDVGDWHFIALNTMSGNAVANAQITWLKGDLAANTKPCTAAYFHHPLMSIGNYSGGYSTTQPIWDALYAAKADLVLNGHDHNYQRYAKLNANQQAATDGMREILVGTGGRAFYSFTTTDPNVEASDDGTHGVLKLTLTSTGYTGDFVPSDGNMFTDHFTGTCNVKSGNPPPTGPVAGFSFATNQLTANFTNSSTDSGGTITAYSWNFGDGASATTASPSHTYAAAGTFNVSLTVTDNNGASNTKSQSVTVASSGGSTQLLGNTGFETGTATPWTATSGVVSNDSSESPHTGSWFAWLDGYGSTHTDTLSQQVVIPSGKTSATLSYYLHIDTAETSQTAADTLKVQVLSTSGSVLTTLATYSNVNAAAGYTQHTADLSAYIGKTVVIKFTGTENSSKQTSFVLDDVTLTVQ